MLGFNHWWFILILVIVLIIFGPGKLPQLGSAVGQALKEFRGVTSELKEQLDPTPPPPPPTITVIESAEIPKADPGKSPPGGPPAS
jgi:sec-independent protein translocase protein TatA